MCQFGYLSQKKPGPAGTTVASTPFCIGRYFLPTDFAVIFSANTEGTTQIMVRRGSTPGTWNTLRRRTLWDNARDVLALIAIDKQLAVHVIYSSDLTFEEIIFFSGKWNGHDLRPIPDTFDDCDV